MTITRLFLAAAVGLLSACAGPGGKVPALIRALQGEDPEARAAAAKELGGMGEEAREAIPALTVALKDRHASVYRASASALAAMGEGAVQGVADLAWDASAWVRCRAVETLGMLGPSSAAASVLAQALADHDSCVSEKAARAMGRMGEEALPFITAALRNPNPVVRRNASEALGSMDPLLQARAVAPLVAEFRSKDEFVRGAAAMLLGEMGKAAAPSLTECVRDPDPDLRDKAVEALGRIGWSDEGVTSALLAALKDPVRHVRLKAALSLGRIAEGNPRMLTALLERLSGGDRDQRRGVAEAVGNMGPAGKDAVRALIGLLDDEDAGVREEASEALMKIGTYEAVSAAERHNRKGYRQPPKDR